MKMNNKASVAIYAIMLGLVIILLALALAPAGNEVIQRAMNNTSYTNVSYEFINDSGDVQVANGTIEEVGLDCDNSTINNFMRGTCIVTDYSMAYFFGALILIGGAVAVARIIF